MVEIFSNKIKELRKGCGIPFVFNIMGNYADCGTLKSGELCPTCQAKLQITKELAEQVEKVINNLGTHKSDVDVIDYVKQALSGELK